MGFFRDKEHKESTNYQIVWCVIKSYTFLNLTCLLHVTFSYQSIGARWGFEHTSFGNRTIINTLRVQQLEVHSTCCNPLIWQLDTYLAAVIH